MPKPARLPQHLSYKSTIALLPPPPLIPPIESLRRRLDKHVQRWPPHVNLLYPFLASPSTPCDPDTGSPGPLQPDVLARLRRAVRHTQPFPLRIRRLGHFEHGRHGSATVWLRPECADGEQCLGEPEERKWKSPRMAALQAALQSEFAECREDKRPFSPHLSVAQAKDIAGAAQIEEEVGRVLSDWCRGEGSALGGRIRDGSWEVDWEVGSVVVMERKGYGGRFKVVAEVKLGEEREEEEAKKVERDQAEEEYACVEGDAAVSARPVNSM